MNRLSPVTSCALAVGFGLILSAGCKSHHKPAPPPPPAAQPASQQTVETIRQSYRSYYPNSRVGPVIAVREQDHLAAVGEIPGGALNIGDRVSFVDTNQRVLTTGRVIRVLAEDNRAHVVFDPPSPGGRAPQVGDIMVRF